MRNRTICTFIVGPLNHGTDDGGGGEEDVKM